MTHRVGIVIGPYVNLPMLLSWLCERITSVWYVVDARRAAKAALDRRRCGSGRRWRVAMARPGKR